MPRHEISVKYLSVRLWEELATPTWIRKFSPFLTVSSDLVSANDSSNRRERVDMRILVPLPMDLCRFRFLSKEKREDRASNTTLVGHFLGIRPVNQEKDTASWKHTKKAHISGSPTLYSGFLVSFLKHFLPPPLIHVDKCRRENSRLSGGMFFVCGNAIGMVSSLFSALPKVTQNIDESFPLEFVSLA